MPAKIPLDDQICLRCGNKLNRTTYDSGRLESPAEFRLRVFCSHRCFSLYNTKEHHWLWKGGKKRRPDGYIRLSANDKYEHRAILESHLGRELDKDEFTHHKNGNTSDNRIENLEVLTNSEHRKLHCVSQNRDSKGRWCHCD